jgi:prolyl-tRNA editing enzyme YbaK/EbsC (Cys-tRNA(Pro) deacylase)
LAKAVLLEYRDGYIVAVIPANHRVELSDLAEKLHRSISKAVTTTRACT